MSQLIYSPFNALHSLHPLHRRARTIEDGHTDTAIPLRGLKSANGAAWTPAADIYELENSFKVLLDIPGVSSSDVDVTLDKGILTIRGSKTIEPTGEEAGFKRLERTSGTFVRSFTLPESADGEHITARSDKGVLEVSIPKLVQSQPRSISIEG